MTAGQEPQDISYLCSRMFMFDSRGDIALAEAYTFADPLPDTTPVTGGSGRYRMPAARWSTTSRRSKATTT